MGHVTSWDERVTERWAASKYNIRTEMEGQHFDWMQAETDLQHLKLIVSLAELAAGQNTNGVFSNRVEETSRQIQELREHYEQHACDEALAALDQTESLIQEIGDRSSGRATGGEEECDCTGKVSPSVSDTATCIDTLKGDDSMNGDKSSQRVGTVYGPIGHIERDDSNRLRVVFDQWEQHVDRNRVEEIGAGINRDIAAEKTFVGNDRVARKLTGCDPKTEFETLTSVIVNRSQGELMVIPVYPDADAA